MPVYQYQILNGKTPPEIIEIEERSDASPSTSHPITKEPIKRIIGSPSLVLKHSSQKEKDSLSKENLERHGFLRYERNASGDGYERTAGKSGPSSVKP
ncbi:MAG: hypothetical protein VX821_10550 [Verrucomicrobiota bacterium]|nr:hypothetical protein [Verrucomicrobiota bacterium]